MSDDLISRQAAIDALMPIYKSASLRNRNVFSTARKCMVAIEELPPAQHVGRCKDCKYNPRNPRSYCDNDKIYSYAMCGHLDGGEDGFCSNYKPLGERKEG